MPDDPALVEWHQSYLSNHRVRIAQDLDLVAAHVSASAHVLEFGSVPLLLTAAMHRRNYRVTGCDIAPERYAATINSIGLKVVKCNVETERLPFEDDAFEAVIFNELFEHLRINPIFTLSEVLRVMKPRGVMLLATPNLRSLHGLVNFLLRNRAYSCSGGIFHEYQKLATLGHMGHVREYTTTEVTEFLRNVGFEVSKLIHRGRYSSVLGDLLARLSPSLNPFVSYIAVKPDRANA